MIEMRDRQMDEGKNTEERERERERDEIDVSKNV